VETLSAVFLGLAGASVATCFPGLLNMSAVSISLRAGRGVGYRFSLGMALTFAAQAGLAVFFAKFFTRHPQVLSWLRLWAAPMLVVLAGFFLLKGIRAKRASLPVSEYAFVGRPLLRGAGLALMNLLTVPFFFAFCGWLLADGYLAATPNARAGFTLGAGAGAMLVFGLYVRLAGWMHRRAVILTRNINFVVGGLLILLAVVQGIRVYG
jgi:threonine/homoserine/homoserine lactone efflux protein